MNVKQRYKAAWAGIREEMSRPAEWRSLDDWFMAFGVYADKAFESWYRYHHDQFTGWRKAWRRDRFIRILQERGYRPNEDYYDRLPF